MIDSVAAREMQKDPQNEETKATWRRELSSKDRAHVNWGRFLVAVWDAECTKWMARALKAEYELAQRELAKTRKK
jgi:hypothetical protein